MISFEFRLSAGRIRLPSKLVISLPRTFKCKSNIKNQEQSQITPDTIQKPAPTKEQRPAPSPEPDPKLTTSQPQPIQRRSSRAGPEGQQGSRQAGNIMQFQNLCPGCQSIIEYGCTAYIQLWPRQAADTRAGPSLSDWSEVIRYRWSRERENDSWLLLHQYK